MNIRAPPVLIRNGERGISPSPLHDVLVVAIRVQGTQGAREQGSWGKILECSKVLLRSLMEG